MSEPLWTEEDWRRWRQQGVNVALVGVALLILGPFLLFASLNLVGANPMGAFVGWLFTMTGMAAVVAGYWAYDHYGKKLRRPLGGRCPVVGLAINRLLHATGPARRRPSSLDLGQNRQVETFKSRIQIRAPGEARW